MVLDDQQPGRRHFDDDAQRRNRADGAPDPQRAAVAVYPEVNAGAFDRRCQLDEAAGFERNRALEPEGIRGFVWRQKRQRDRRDDVLFPPETRPERRVDERFDRVGVRRSREAGLAALLRVGEMAREMVADFRRDGVRCRIGRSAHRPRERRGDSTSVPGGDDRRDAARRGDAGAACVSAGGGGGALAL